jgi:hypothetical protein
MNIFDYMLGRNRQAPEPRAAEDDFYSTVAPARVVGVRDATEEEMTLINKLAAKPLTVNDVYVIEPVVSTNALDSYDTRMAPSSLTNYVNDGNSGCPGIIGHDRKKLPCARSFKAELVQRDGLDCVQLYAYMLKGHSVSGESTDEIARGINGGTITDLSISFGGPDYYYRCGICNRSLFDSECPHVPGVMYDDVRAFAWVEDAHMSEWSFVYDGATPGAVMRKARSMADAGQLSREQIRLLEDRLRCRISSTNIKEPENNPGTKTEDNSMKARAFLDALWARFRSNADIAN